MAEISYARVLNSSMAKMDADFTAASHKPPKCGARGGMNFKSIPSAKQTVDIFRLFS